MMGYQEVEEVKVYSNIVVVTKDQRIVDVCNNLHMEVMLTADIYAIIMGDEPLIISAEDETRLGESMKQALQVVYIIKYRLL